jgi:putative glutamine amidotransferase
MTRKPRIAIPEPTSFDPAYNQRGWPQYAHAIECSGGVAVPVPLTETLESAAKIIAGCSGVLLPGSGADLDPKRFGQEPNPASAPPDQKREAVDDLLLTDAFAHNKPVLGICYGLQSMNVWRHGALDQHIPGTGIDHAPGRDVHEAHGVRVEVGSRLAAILGATDSEPVRVNSSHHQAVSKPGEHLAVVARSAVDGVIEALEDAQSPRFVLGVQWHPERTFGLQAGSRAIFGAFLKAAEEWQSAAVDAHALKPRPEPVAR